MAREQWRRERMVWDEVRETISLPCDPWQMVSSVQWEATGGFKPREGYDVISGFKRWLRQELARSPGNCRQGWRMRLPHMCLLWLMWPSFHLPSSPSHHSIAFEIAMRSGSAYTFRALTDAAPWQRSVDNPVYFQIYRPNGYASHGTAKRPHVYGPPTLFAGCSPWLCDFTLEVKNIRQLFLSLWQMRKLMHREVTDTQGHTASWWQSQD